jgi:UDP-N-acetylmuramate dehydrogenase
MISAAKPRRGRLLFDEPMARHTSWRVGGPADRLYLPADLDDLAAFLKSLPADEPLHWVGLGSNLLVRDGGVRGTVIMTSGALLGLAITGEGVVRAEAGVPCAKLARFCVQNGMRGGEFLAGIPGTVGGALAMNAGCHGSETWQFVEAVETLDRHGERRRREPKEYRIAYRSVKGAADGTEARAAGQGRPASGLEGEWFVAGHFRFAPDDRQEGKGLIKRLLARRGATQPTQLPNAGSVFKNPPNDFAARLIEASGLKGSCEGRACVSELHANFIVNTGGASAAEIERLIARVQREVEAKQGVRLETEVRIIGEAGQ